MCSKIRCDGTKSKNLEFWRHLNKSLNLSRWNWWDALVASAWTLVHSPTYARRYRLILPNSQPCLLLYRFFGHPHDTPTPIETITLSSPMSTETAPRWKVPGASWQGTHLAWLLGYELCHYPFASLGERGQCTSVEGHLISGQLEKWCLPRLCNSLGEALEASIGRGRLRRTSVVDVLRHSHDCPSGRGGCVRA
jgi:hypothetical protein